MFLGMGWRYKSHSEIFKELRMAVLPDRWIRGRYSGDGLPGGLGGNIVALMTTPSHEVAQRETGIPTP